MRTIQLRNRRRREKKEKRNKKKKENRETKERSINIHQIDKYILVSKTTTAHELEIIELNCSIPFYYQSLSNNKR